MRVLITQQAQDAAISAAALRARGHTVLAVPLVTAERAPPPKITLAGAQGFIVTSSEGARALADHVGVRTFPVFADSDVTAAELRRLGFKQVFPAKDDATDLAKLIERSLAPANGALLYACSTSVGPNLSAMLGNMGFAVRLLPLFTIKRVDAMPADLHAALQGAAVDAALFLSADEARAFVTLVQRAQLEPLVAKLSTVAASPIVAAPLRALKLGGVSVPARADLDTIFDAFNANLVDRVEEERLDRERAARAEQERLAQEQAERERIVHERAEKERAEQERAAQEKAAREQAAREKAEQEHRAREQAERDKAERKRLAEEEAARARDAKRQADLERAAKEKAEKDRLAAERAEKDRLEHERLAQEKAARERVAQEKAAQEKAERERLAAERAEQDRVERERLAREKAERDRIAREKAEQDRIERERLAAERAEQDRVERERLAQEKAERDRIAREQIAQAKSEKERLALEQAERDRQERERLAAEKAEHERIARAQAEKDRAEKQRLADEQAERDRIERERLAAEKAAREQLAREQKEKERAERQRLADAQAERDRIERERLTAERLERERIAREKAAQDKAEKAERDRAAREQAAQEKAEKKRIAREEGEQARAARGKAKQDRLLREAEERAALPPRPSLVARITAWRARPTSEGTAEASAPTAEISDSLWNMAVHLPAAAPASPTQDVAEDEPSATMAPTVAAPAEKPEPEPVALTPTHPPDRPQAEEDRPVSEHVPQSDADAAPPADSKATPRGGGRAARLQAEDAADDRAKDQRFKYLGRTETPATEPTPDVHDTDRDDIRDPLNETRTVPPPRQRSGAGRVAALFVVLAIMAAAVIGTASWWVPRVTQAVQGTPVAAPAPVPASAAQSDLAALKAQVAALEQQTAATLKPEALAAVKQELTQRIAALEARTGDAGEQAVTSLGDSLSSQAKQLVAVSARIATLEAAIGNSARLEDLSQRMAMLEGRSAEANSVLALSDRVTLLETTGRRAIAEQTTQVALLMAVAQWREALTAGRPFALELQTAKALAARTGEAAIDDTAFAAYAARGIPTLQDLQRRFDDTAAAAMRAGAMPEGASAWYRRILNRIMSIVTIRRLDGDAAGNSTSAVLARAERRLAEGDITAAVTELTALTGGAATAAESWLAPARARVAAERASSDATTKAVAAVAASANAPSPPEKAQ